MFHPVGPLSRTERLWLNQVARDIVSRGQTYRDRHSRHFNTLLDARLIRIPPVWSPSIDTMVPVVLTEDGINMLEPALAVMYRLRGAF